MSKFTFKTTVLSLGLIMAIAPMGLFADELSTANNLAQNSALNPPPKPPVPAEAQPGAVNTQQTVTNAQQATANAQSKGSAATSTNTKPAPKKKVVNKKKAKRKANSKAAADAGYGNLKDIPDPIDLNSD